MFGRHILCSGCGREYPIKELIFRCRECGGSLEVVFDYRRLRGAVGNFRGRPFNHLRYRELYPVREPLALGEGGTPLIRSKNLERELGLGFRLWFKCEFLNPTGSFKDRGSSIEVARALETMKLNKARERSPRPGLSTKRGLAGRGVVCASTGNMGASVAAYSALAGLECSIFAPRDAPPVKLEQILAYGARVFHVNGNYAQVAGIAEQAFEKYGAYLLGDYLFRREGTKSVGFEIGEQLPGTDYVFCPVGNGTLISAAWKAFREFRILGLLKKTPKMAGIQASGCAPLIKGRPVRNPHTLATAIECGDPLDGKRALEAVRESKGFMGKVTDREILGARELLARREGLFAEPAGAAALAGILKAKGSIEEGSRVVCLVTGHGLKAPYTGIRGRAREAGLKIELGRIF